MSASTGAAAGRDGSSLGRLLGLLDGAGSRRDESPQPASNAGQVRTDALTGEHARHALGDDRVPERTAFGGDRRHRDHLVARPQDPPQRLVPLHERLTQQ